MTNLLRNVRILGWMEGVSLLLLMFVAMPLKYGWDEPILVKIIGPIHGIVFLFYVAFVLLAWRDLKWSFLRIVFPLLLASIIPFGNFYVDVRILKKMLKP